MGIRLGLATVLLVTSGCAMEPVSQQPDPSPTPPPYADPAPGQRRVAKDFVQAVLEYDARREARRQFLAEIEELATPTEIGRLAHSGRAHLNWRALEARHERTKATVTGVSRLPDRTNELAVTATITTRSTVGVVRQFALISLHVERIDGHWVVTDASGAGL